MTVAITPAITEAAVSDSAGSDSAGSETTSLNPNGSSPGHRQNDGWLQRPMWNRFTPLQLVVLGLASIAPAVILSAVGAAMAGLIDVEAMIEVALGAGENPGMITFGAMFLASPVQWLTGRSQVRVRKYLGIVFYWLAISNGAMFAIERSPAEMLAEPLLVAGTVALALATPLFATSSRLAQRTMGMKNWRILHRLTYVIAAALLAHVALVGDLGPGALLIGLGFVARIPAARRWLQGRSARRGAAVG